MNTLKNIVYRLCNNPAPVMVLVLLGSVLGLGIRVCQLEDTADDLRTASMALVLESVIMTPIYKGNPNPSLQDIFNQEGFASKERQFNKLSAAGNGPTLREFFVMHLFLGKHSKSDIEEASKCVGSSSAILQATH
jgi:hypothetical protein